MVDYSTMSDFIEQHLALLRAEGKSPATIRDRGRCLRRLHDDMPGGIVYACREQLQAWLDYDQWSVRTKLVYYSHLSAFFRWLYLEQIIDEDPTVRIAHPRRPRSLPRPASEAQLQLALTAPEPLRLAVILANWEGLRRAEAAHLDREDVTESLVLVRRAKGGDEQTVPTHPLVWEAIRDRPAGALIVDDHGERLGTERLGWLAYRWFRSHGYPERFGLHAFRHRFATLIQGQFHDLRITQECMRHRSVSSTQVYTQVTEGQRAEAIRRLPGMNSPSQGLAGSDGPRAV